MIFIYSKPQRNIQNYFLKLKITIRGNKMSSLNVFDEFIKK
jgi:hypothetical protein